jgi:hypothetical protein
MQTKTILVLAVVGVGGLLLYERLKPAPAATSPWVTLGASLGGAVQGAKTLWGSITGGAASSGYTVDAVDNQDDTIIPTPVASSSASIDLARSSFSKSVPGRASLGMAI